MTDTLSVSLVCACSRRRETVDLPPHDEALAQLKHADVIEAGPQQMLLPLSAVPHLEHLQCACGQVRVRTMVPWWLGHRDTPQTREALAWLEAGSWRGHPLPAVTPAGRHYLYTSVFLPVADQPRLTWQLAVADIDDKSAVIHTSVFSPRDVELLAGLVRTYDVHGWHLLRELVVAQPDLEMRRAVAAVTDSLT